MSCHPRTEEATMRFLRRKRRADEDLESRCAICREPLPDDAIECNMCGAPAQRIGVRPIAKRDVNADRRLNIR
jgi:hypothetical protein